MYPSIATSGYHGGARPLAVPPRGMGRLLVVEEDADRRRAILSHVTAQDCVALGCGRREVGRHLQGAPFSVILAALPSSTFGAIDMVRLIRQRSNVPLILYGNAQSAEIDRVLCLEEGADDVLCGSPDLHELLARARAILRRQELGRLGARALRGGFRFDGWELRHTPRQLVSPSQEAVALTNKEYALLVAFLESPGRSLSRLHLMRVTRPHEDIFDRSIDVEILRLRRKLARDPGGQDMIKTHRGKGYALDACVEPFA